MKLFLFLAVFLQMNAFAQQGEHIRIEFLADHDSFPDCRTLFYANTNYVLPNQEFLEINIPNMILVNPSNLLNDSVMILRSFSSEAKKLGSVKFDEIQIHTYSREEVRGLIITSADSADCDWRIHDMDYLWTNFGIIYDAKPNTRIQKNTEEQTVQEESPFTPMIGQSGIIDGVYLDERELIRIQQLDSMRIPIDYYYRSFRLGSRMIQPKLDSLFQPFYFSNYEVTNGEYREFIKWVTDSIKLRMAYRNLTSRDASLLLDCSKRERKVLDLSRSTENLKQFGLNLRNRKKISDMKWFEATKEMYYPQPERFYRRKELNEHKLIYRKSESEMIAIYPDTLGFCSDQLGEGMAFIGRLTWHPYYTNYPVTNISKEQIMAYCHWRQRQLNEELKSDGYKVMVRPPTITEYEFALKQSLGPRGYSLAIDQKNDHFIRFNRSPALENEALFYTSVDYDPANPPKSNWPTSYEFMLNYKRWYQANQSESLVKFLNGNVSEFAMDEVTLEKFKHYRIDQSHPEANAHFVLGSNYLTDVKTLGDDQYNAIFYKSVLENGKSSPLVGFRLVYFVERIN